MKKLIFLMSIFSIIMSRSNAQTTAMNFSGDDCFGNYVNLSDDLDAGKAVVLFFYMPNCSSCPPPAQKIQTMAQNINSMHPGMVKAYAFPFQNSTTCSYSSSWVTSNNLSMYAPMDSGATQVAYYGGFGMPTVVLLGGIDHRVMFSTLSFATSDTTIMRDSIMSMLNITSINTLNNSISNLDVFPNPVTDVLSVNIELKQLSEIKIEVVDINGKPVDILLNEKGLSGLVKKQFTLSHLANGSYFILLSVNGEKIIKNINVIR